MTSKNNQIDRLTKEMPLTQRYALRKLSVGVASVLLGTTIAMGLNGKVVQADTNVSKANQTAATNASLPATMGNTATLPAVTSNSASQVTAASATDGSSNSATSAAYQIPATSPVDSAAYTVSNVRASSVAGNGTDQTGETQLAFDIDLNFNGHEIKTGDYLDISMGLPYKTVADGEEHILAYGGSSSQASEINVDYTTTHGGEHRTALVGYLLPVGNGDHSYAVSYHESPTADVNNVVWQKTDNNNELTSNGIGASNDRYRIIFNDALQKLKKQYADHNLTDAKMTFKLTWHNLSGFNLDTAPLDTKNFHLYSDGDSTTLIPENDIKIGDKTFTSGLAIKVNGKENDQANFSKVIIPVSSSKFAAHTWYYNRQTKKWGLGDEILRYPWQTEAVQLAAENNGVKLGNDFTITVTKPANKNKLIEYYFIGNDDLRSALMKAIVVKHENYDLDPVDGQKGIYVTRTMVSSTVPNIEVTSTDSTDGLTRTYHVKVDGDYLAFNENKAVDLINWKPAEARDFFAPKSINGPEEDTMSQQGYYDGVQLVNSELQNYLANNPWHLKVANSQGATLYDSPAGYYVQPYTYRDDVTSNRGILTGNINNVENKQINETIYYKYFGSNEEAAPTYKANASFVHYNEDGVWQDWNPASETFARVENPVVVGYHAVDKDGQPVAAVDAIKVTHDSSDVETTIYYMADAQRLTYTVIDEDTGENLANHVDLADGKSNEAIPADTAAKYQAVQDKYINEGYYLSKQPDALPSSFDNNSDVDQNVNIYVRKRNVKKTETANPVRTITYYDKLTGERINIPKKTDPVSQTASFTRDAVYSGVDGSLLGYNTTGKTDENGNYLVDVTPEKGDTAWKLVDGGWPASTNPDLSYFGYEPAENVAGDAYPAVVVERPTATTANEEVKVYYQPRITSGEETTTSQRTIHYVYGNGPREGRTAAPDAVQTVTYTRTTATNEVTHATTNGDWQPTASVTTVDGQKRENEIKGSFAAVTSPSIKDYTPDQVTVSSVTAHEGADPIDVTVRYTTEPHQITYTVIDDVTGLKLDNDKYLTKGFVDTQLPVSAITSYKMVPSKYEEMGYTLVSADGLPTAFADHDQNLAIHLTHATSSVTDTHTIHEDIKYRFVDGDEAAPTYNAAPITFTRTGTTDQITKKTVWQNWTPSSNSFVAVTSPTIAGYSTETPAIAEQPVTPATDDLHFLVVYTKNTPVVPHPETPVEPENPTPSSTPASSAPASASSAPTVPDSSASSASSAPAQPSSTTPSTSTSAATPSSTPASSTPGDSTPANSTASETPVPGDTPAVAEPAVSQVAQPVTPHAAGEATTVNRASQAPAHMHSTTTAKTLPQTGNQHRSIWQMILGVFLGLFGITLGGKKKRN